MMKPSILIVMGLVLTASVAQADEPDLAHGKAVFSRNCALCHGAAGAGGLGPKLKGIKDRKTDAEIESQLKEPKGTMPKMYPAPVGDKDLADVVAYLKSL